MAFASGIAGGQALAQGPREFSGAASYYDKDYTGQTASGGLHDGKELTAAHRTLPFGTHLSVTDPKTHRSVTVTVNDRGPFVNGRVLDLSFAAAQELHMIDLGLIDVTAAVE